MPNKITYTVQTANTTKSVEYWNPYTNQYQDDNPLVSIPAGTYSGLKARLKGSNPPIIATYSGSVTVTGVVVTPTISGFSPTSGLVGATIVITGSNFTGATLVSVNSGAVASYTVDSDAQITAVLSSAQATGKVRVTTPNGTAVSAADFIVTTNSATPIISSFTPTTATAGSTVVLTGTNFTGATAVQLNGAAVASYTVDSNTQISAVLAANSTSGKFRVIGANSSVGTSSTDFTVKQIEVNFVFQGDSITAGALNQPGEDYPSQVKTAMGSRFTAVNVGKPGHTTVDGIQDAAQTDAAYDSSKFTHQFASYFIGTNDVSNGVPVATTKANIEQWHRDRIAKGFKTFAVTILPKTNPLNYQVSAQIADINQHIKDNYRSWGCIALIDAAAIAEMKQPDDNTIYWDGTHPNKVGQQYLAREFKKGIDAYYATVNFPVASYTWDVDTVGSLYSLEVGSPDVLENATAGTATGNAFVGDSGNPGGSVNGKRKMGASTAKVRGWSQWEVVQSGEIIAGLNQSAAAESGNNIPISAYSSPYLGYMIGRGSYGGNFDPYPILKVGDVFRVQLENNPFLGKEQVTYYINGVKWVSYAPNGGFPIGNYSFDGWYQGASIKNVLFWAANEV